MPENGSVIGQAFDEAFPPEFLLHTTATVHQAYARADGFARQFDKPERHDIRRLVQRVYFEGAWRGLARRSGLHATANQNAAGNCFHTYIQSGRVALTANFVETPNTPVRRAVFREGYAQGAQPDLFLRDEPPPPDASVYAILLHGADRTAVATPAFIRVRFPTRDCQAYLEEQVDLMKRFPRALPVAPEIPEEEIREELEVEIHKHLTEQGRRHA